MNDFQHLCAQPIFQLGFSAGLFEVLFFGQFGHSGFGFLFERLVRCKHTSVSAFADIWTDCYN